ncbi:hypothetical protein [Fluviispira sanaruensis]|uniref:Uncharacterized protein n=1 Tax=Fluviispira sanaruensis TaxID=2493639 RepID=A0A4P2VLY6_FLUSA|nr:hypothetical protein [Fluviispira sanaruensis]BBH52419.1 hypothetical protein JCM31447_317100 [Fluviispira sanaruensis]
MGKYPEIKSLKKDMFIANERTAPHCFILLSNLELRLLVDIYQRISHKIVIFENYNGIMIEKIKHIILQNLLKDKLIIEGPNGFIAAHNDLLFESPVLNEKVKRIAGAVEGSLDVMTEKNLEESKICYLNYKKVPKEKYDEIISDAKKLLFKITNFYKFQNKGNVDCEFIYLCFFTTKERINNAQYINSFNFFYIIF